MGFKTTLAILSHDNQSALILHNSLHHLYLLYIIFVPEIEERFNPKIVLIMNSINNLDD